MSAIVKELEAYIGKKVVVWASDCCLGATLGGTLLEVIETKWGVTVRTDGGSLSHDRPEAIEFELMQEKL
ncbi:MAG: hypothetical protein ACE5F5_11795 [Acidimicrobiia bacterium]